MTTATNQKPSTEDIARQAYLLYQQRGCQPGHELEDWLEAETVLNVQASRKTSAASSGSGTAENNAKWQQPVKAPEPFAAKHSKSL